MDSNIIDKVKPADLLRLFRENMGLKQSQVAALLGVSRSNISMAEGRRRQLPAEAQKKMEVLHTHFREILTATEYTGPEPLPEETKANLKINIEFREQEIIRALNKAKTRLAWMKEQFITSSRYLENIERMEGKLNPGTKWDAIVKMQHYHAGLEVKKCSLLAQGKLQFEIDLLTVQAKYLENYFSTTA